MSRSVAVVGASPVLVEGVSQLLCAQMFAAAAVDEADVVVGLEPEPPTGFGDVPWVVVSGRVEPDALPALVAHGVRAVVDPSEGADGLSRAVARVLDGGHGLNRAHVDALAYAVRGQRAQQSVPVRLTPREKDVLRALHQGLSQKQTAVSLGVSVKTVENTQRLLFSKLGVHSRAAAVARSHAAGIDLTSGQGR